MKKHILMIKKCKITGMRYLCKTTGKDPYSYHGSGLRWVNHLKKYHTNWSRSKDVETTILGEYETNDALREAGIHYSELYDVVKSQVWANIVAEEGTGGWINDQTGKRWKVKDTSKMKGGEGRKGIKYPSMQGERNYQSKGWFITPWGKFPTVKEATKQAKEQRKDGNTYVVSDGHTLLKYCINENTTPLNIEGRRTPKEWRGKTPQEIGFGYEIKI